MRSALSRWRASIRSTDILVASVLAACHSGWAPTFSLRQLIGMAHVILDVSGYFQ